jgi:hypothetical protein
MVAVRFFPAAWLHGDRLPVAHLQGGDLILCIPHVHFEVAQSSIITP